MGIWHRSQDTVTDYLAVSRWAGLFIWPAFVSRNWFAAEYTQVKLVFVELHGRFQPHRSGGRVSSDADICGYADNDGISTALG